MRQIPYGDVNFKKIRTQNLLYVDKTMYIEALEKNPQREKSIYLRPRRFGKSLFTSMLTYYYSVDEADEFEKLFKGLYIYDNPTENKNNYYVLNFNFSGLTISQNNIIEDGKNAFYNAVKDSLTDFINKYKLSIELEGDSASDILRNLLVKFKNLNLKHKIYIIIDEYDNFTNAMLKGDAQDFLDLVNKNGYVRAFYEVIKMKLEDGIIARFFATGVMPVTLDNLTSGFNIATKLSTDPDFTSMIGFTHEEVRQIVEEVVPIEDVEKVYNDLKENYDGYRFSDDSEEKTFNSTLVMYYLSNYITRKEPPKKLLDSNMNTSGDKIKRIVELIKPEENYKTVNEILFNNEVSGRLKDVILDSTEYSKNDLITMLFHLGYITISSAGMQTKFTIPNAITRSIYSEYLAELLKIREGYKIETDRITDAIVDLGENGNIQATVELIKDFLVHCSNRDTENFSEMVLKHVFITFLSLSNQFIVYGEYPAKQGFVDVFVAKTSSSMATYEAIIELKYLSKEKAKSVDKDRLLEDGRIQLTKYVEDKRLLQKEHLKKYVIIFTGFDDVVVEEM